MVGCAGVSGAAEHREASVASAPKAPNRSPRRIDLSVKSQLVRTAGHKIPHKVQKFRGQNCWAFS